MAILTDMKKAMDQIDSNGVEAILAAISHPDTPPRRSVSPPLAKLGLP
jgi:hypothetical protein